MFIFTLFESAENQTLSVGLLQLPVKWVQESQVDLSFGAGHQRDAAVRVTHCDTAPARTVGVIKERNSGEETLKLFVDVRRVE